jgi:polyhydroxyalkanoate synthesis repressor PhaR
MAAAVMAILIKRYANRKLYNTATSRYITLKGIAELLDAGEEVQVVDNETGEDITSVALSQILVDSERSNKQPSDTLLSQILGRGGDVLYGALKRGVDDAAGGIDEVRDRVRKAIAREEHLGFAGWLDNNRADFEKTLQTSMERVFRLLDLPRRSDLDALNDNLSRVAEAVEKLEKVYGERQRRTNGDGGLHEDPPSPASDQPERG